MTIFVTFAGRYLREATFFVSNTAGASIAAQDFAGDWTRTARKGGEAEDRGRIITFSPSHPYLLSK